MQQQNAPLDEPTATAKKPEPVRLRSAHDFSLVTAALEFRTDDLKKLSKKVGEDGYHREARAISADAEAIERVVLPAFREQRELPLVTHEQLEKEITGALKRFVAHAFSGLGDPKVIVTPASVDSRKETLVATLTTRIALYVKEVADDAFNQGVAARAQTSEALAMRAIGTLRATGE
jgi:hypothetical protein